MIDGLSPYPEYRPSGVEWLGEVPAHWEVKRLGWIADLIVPMRDKPEIFDGDIPWIRIEDFNGKYISDSKSEQRVSKDTVKRMNLKVYPAGTVLCSCSCNMGCSAIVTRPLISNQTFIGIVPKARASSNYLYYLLISCGSHLQSMSSGAIQQYLSRYDFSHLSIPLPPLPEQSAIVRFLDHADARIRSAVSARRRLITLLDEEKQAIIHRAVTRGLDPDVPLKPSGVEWLGDIPEHWDVRLNQRLFKEEVRAYDGQIKTQLSLSQRHGLVPTDTMEERTLQTSSYDNWKVVIPGDLVLNRFKAHLGVFFSATLRGIVSFHYGVFLPRIPLVTKYFELLYHTNVYRTIYAGCSNGMTVGLQNLSNQNFYNVRSIVPPVQEQAAILSFAEKVTEQLNVEIHSTKREIDLLLEFRTRLIADVVTGKLDVRGVAAGLPAATPGQATLDAFDAPAGDGEDAWPEPGAALEDGDGIGA